MLGSYPPFIRERISAHLKYLSVTEMIVQPELICLYDSNIVGSFGVLSVTITGR